jgi:predicted small secreted protein
MRLKMATGALAFIVLTGAAALLSACNTTEGAGKDIAAGGRAIERAADRNK